MKDTIKLFIEFMKNAKSSEDFILWTSISMVAGALGRKVWVDINGYSLYPNLFILLIGKPGITYKTSVARRAADFLSELKTTNMLSENLTPAAMLNQMSEHSRLANCMIEGKSFHNGACFLYSGEIVNVLGKSKYGNMVNILTELYDSDPNGWHKDRPWKKDTLASGSVHIYNPCLNVLGATTPDTFIGQIISRDEIKSGFVSRLITVYDAFPKPKKSIWETEAEAKAREAISLDIKESLKTISKLSGPMLLDDSVKEAYLNFMEENDEVIVKETDDRVNSFLGRKPNTILKVATVLTAAEAGSKRIELRHWEAARLLIERMSEKSDLLFAGHGESRYVTCINEIKVQLRKYNGLLESELLTLLFKDYDSRMVEEAMRTMIKMRLLGQNRDNGKYILLESVSSDAKDSSPRPHGSATSDPQQTNSEG